MEPRCLLQPIYKSQLNQSNIFYIFKDHTQPQEVSFCWLQSGPESSTYNACLGTMVQVQQVSRCNRFIFLLLCLGKNDSSPGSHFHKGWYQNILGSVTDAWLTKGLTVVPDWITETLGLQPRGRLHPYPTKHI